MGESQEGGLKLHFDGHLRLVFKGAKVTSDAVLRAVRELDEMMGLADMAADLIEDKRTGTYKSQSQGNISPCTTLWWFPFMYVSLWRTPRLSHVHWWPDLPLPSCGPFKTFVRRLWSSRRDTYLRLASPCLIKSRRLWFHRGLWGLGAYPVIDPHAQRTCGINLP